MPRHAASGEHTDGTGISFDPLNLAPSASLNRARIVDLPGVALDPDVRGQTGYGLLGADSLAATVATSWRAVAPFAQPLASHAVVGVASYVRDGCIFAQPVSVYKDLSAVPQPASRWLTWLVSERVGLETELTLLRDGTAAARTYAGAAHAAVLSLGAAVGMGFAPPAADAVRPIAAAFRVSAAG